MTEPATGSLNPSPQLVDGIDVDAVAAAVRSCPDVDELDGGAFDVVASYLPGRRVPGVRVGDGRVTVQLRSRWGVPVARVGAQVRVAVAALISGRALDIVVADIADPPELLPLPVASGESEVRWTTSSDSVPVVPSSEPITPTSAVTPMSSSPGSPPSIPPA